MTLPEIPNFASLFQFDQRVSALESEMSEFRQTSQFAKAVSSILGIVDTYLASKMKEIDSTMKGIIKEQVQAQVSKIMPKIVKYVTESLEAEVSNTQKNLYNALVESYNIDKDIITSYGDVVTLKRGRDDQDKDEDPSAGSNQGASKSQPQSSDKSVHVEEHDQKTANLEDQPHQDFDTGNEDVSSVRGALNEDVWHRNPSRPLTPDRTQSSFNEFLATLVDFSAFIMHRLKIDNLTQNVLTGPTYDLIKGTCKSVVELEYHLEEVFKSTNDRLDWHNPEGKPYPHDLSKLLPLILNAHGRQVILLDHFINNDLEYLKGGSSSQKYTTSITKTKAADYDEMNINRLMRIDELHKFSDGTLNHVRTTLNDIDRGIEMDYLPKRKQSKQDKKRARMMINVIDKKLRDRRLMRSLEKFVGGREYENDIRLLERTI
ncbi:hypothetical protein Tco_0445800 [Tanacetum coccineum]